MNEKKQVSEFKKKYKLKNIKSAELCKTLSVQGYTVVEFNGINDSDDVSNLIDALKLDDMIVQHK